MADPFRFEQMVGREGLRQKHGHAITTLSQESDPRPALLATDTHAIGTNSAQQPHTTELAAQG